MDVGTSNGWDLKQVVSGAEILKLIEAQFPLQAVESAYRGAVAARWRYTDQGGELGLLTSVSQPFCGDCPRERLSQEGHLFLCLFASGGSVLLQLLRTTLPHKRNAT